MKSNNNNRKNIFTPHSIQLCVCPELEFLFFSISFHKLRKLVFYSIYFFVISRFVCGTLTHIEICNKNTQTRTLYTSYVAPFFVFYSVVMHHGLPYRPPLTVCTQRQVENIKKIFIVKDCGLMPKYNFVLCTSLLHASGIDFLCCLF